MLLLLVLSDALAQLRPSPVLGSQPPKCGRGIGVAGRLRETRENVRLSAVVVRIGHEKIPLGISTANLVCTERFRKLAFFHSNSD